MQQLRRTDYPSSFQSLPISVPTHCAYMSVSGLLDGLIGQRGNRRYHQYTLPGFSIFGAPQRVCAIRRMRSLRT